MFIVSFIYGSHYISGSKGEKGEKGLFGPQGLTGKYFFEIFFAKYSLSPSFWDFFPNKKQNVLFQLR